MPFNLKNLDIIEWLVTHSIKQMVDHVQYDICTFPMQEVVFDLKKSDRKADF